MIPGPRDDFLVIIDGPPGKGVMVAVLATSPIAAVDLGVGPKTFETPEAATAELGRPREWLRGLAPAEDLVPDPRVAAGDAVEPARRPTPRLRPPRTPNWSTVVKEYTITP